MSDDYKAAAAARLAAWKGDALGLIGHLQRARDQLERKIERGECLDAHPGELTSECGPKSCGICRLRSMPKLERDIPAPLLSDIAERLGHFRDDVALQCHPWQEAAPAAVYRLLVKDCDALILRIEEAL